MTATKTKLTALKDLYSGDLSLKKGQNELNILLNQPPNKTWVKEHPIAKGVKYIPIERVEYLLTRLFFKWRVEIKQLQIIANSCVVTVRLHYQNIEDNEWSWQDGIGAAPLQTDKGAGAIEFDKIKNDAVMKAAPAAESYAVKDAAEKIGKIFGKDLNRKDVIGYEALEGTIPEDKVTLNQLAYADELIRTSTLDEGQKDIAYSQIQDQELTLAEYKAITNKLRDAQTKKY